MSLDVMSGTTNLEKMMEVDRDQVFLKPNHKQRSYFDFLDPSLVRHICAEYIDCYSLVALSRTSKYFNQLICGLSEVNNVPCNQLVLKWSQSVVDELLKRISPLLSRNHFSVRTATPLHAINFYEEIKRAKRQFLVSCGEEHTVVVVETLKESHSKEDNNNTVHEVFTFGNGENGRLGTGDELNKQTPAKVDIPELETGDTKVQSVVGGANHTLVLTTSGNLYGFGSNEMGQLGPWTPSRSILKPSNLLFPKVPVSMISCAKDYSAIVLGDELGSVIIMGNGLPANVCDYAYVKGGVRFKHNNNGRSDDRVVKTKFKSLARGGIRSNERIVEVSAGYHHLLLITSTGKPYAVGSNVFGQIGCASGMLETTQDNQMGTMMTSLNLVLEPIEVNFDWKVNPVAQVAAGENHSLLLTRDGHLFSWGANGNGQLGQGTFCRAVLCPQKVQLPKSCFPIIITCGNDHSIVLDLDGKIVTFGCNSFGQTGSGTTFFASNRPIVVKTGELAFKTTDEWLQKKWFRQLSHIAAGKNHTAVFGDVDSAFFSLSRNENEKAKSRLITFGQRKFCGNSVPGLKISGSVNNGAEELVMLGKMVPAMVNLDTTGYCVQNVRKLTMRDDMVFVTPRYLGNFNKGNFTGVRRNL